MDTFLYWKPSIVDILNHLLTRKRRERQEGGGMYIWTRGGRKDPWLRVIEIEMKNSKVHSNTTQYTGQTTWFLLFIITISKDDNGPDRSDSTTQRQKTDYNERQNRRCE